MDMPSQHPVTTMEDEELEKLRRERLAQAQSEQAHSQEAAEQAQKRQEEEQARRDAVLRQILTTEARERLTRIRIARPDQAQVLEQQLVALAQSGRLNQKLGDEDIKMILARLFPPKREINIRRKGKIEE
jgi:programmed cell death protein 5